MVEHLGGALRQGRSPYKEAQKKSSVIDGLGKVLRRSCVAEQGCCD